MKIKTLRNFRRVQQRNEKELTMYLSNFVTDCKNTESERWDKLYNQYEKMWCDYASRINRNSKEVIIFIDGFEAAVLRGYNAIKNNSDKQLVEIFWHFKKKNIFDRIKKYLKDYYARALA